MLLGCQLARHLVAKKAREAHDEVERSLELMADDRQELVLVAIALFQLANRRLQFDRLAGELVEQPAAHRDVAHDGHREHAVRGANRAQARIDRELAAVLPATVRLQARSHRTHARMIEVLAPVAGMDAPEPLGDQDLDRLA
ncbi:hypothetical protein D3C86_1848020 [compost metagenome]